MKLKELIKKLLGHKIEYTSALSSLNDCIPILSREIFEGDKEKIKYLEDIKKEYSDILTKKRTVLSIDLNTSNLYGQMNMYIEMLHNLLDVEEVDNSFEKAFYYNDGTKKINMMIKMSKLKLYYRRIEKLAIEANVRRMALKEIFDEKLFLSSKKKNSIKEEMNHLAGTLLVYTNQIQTIKLQIDSYLMNYETLGNEEFVERDIETELLNKKQEELKQMIEEFMIEDKRDIENCDNEFLTIAFMEEALSKYIYEHEKVEVEKLWKEIYLLNTPNPEQVLSQIEKLELKAKALTVYGHNIIEKDDLRRLYGLKFLAITDNIMIKEEQNLAEKCNFIELECYGEFITNSISTILHGDDWDLKEKFSPNYSIVVQAITKVLKNKDNEFSIIDILNDKKKLGLLLAVERKNGLENYFKTCMEPMSKYNYVNFHERIFDFEEILPLDTIYSMIYYNEESSLDPLYEVYKILKKEQERNSMYFKLPAGLREINGFYNRMDFENKRKYAKELEMEQKFIKRLRDLSSDCVIEFPSSLQRINGNIFSNMSFIDIIFNNGIKEISNDAFRGVKAKTIFFPQSLVRIGETAFSNAKIMCLYFDEYEQLMLDNFSLSDLIRSMFHVYISEKRRYVPDLPDSTKRELWLLTYEVYPTFGALILNQSLENDCEHIIITGPELVMEFVKKTDSSSQEISYFDCVEILRNIKKIVKSKKGKTLKKLGGFNQ